MPQSPVYPGHHSPAIPATMPIRIEGTEIRKHRRHPATDMILALDLELTDKILCM